MNYWSISKYDDEWNKIIIKVFQSYFKIMNVLEQKGMNGQHLL